MAFNMDWNVSKNFLHMKHETLLKNNLKYFCLDIVTLMVIRIIYFFAYGVICSSTYVSI